MDAAGYDAATDASATFAGRPVRSRRYKWISFDPVVAGVDDQVELVRPDLRRAGERDPMARRTLSPAAAR